MDLDGTDLDGAGRTGRNLGSRGPGGRDLDAMAPDDLVECWRGGTGRARDDAGLALIRRYEKVVRAVVRDESGEYGVSFRNSRERHEFGSDLLVTVFDAAVGYDPTKSAGDGDGFEHWLRYTLRHRLSELGGIDGAVEVPDSWQRVGRIAAKVTDHLAQQLCRPPTLDEVKAGTLTYATSWAKDRLVEAGVDGPLEALAVAKLRKQGTLGAIERLDQVVALRTRTTTLDESTVDSLSVSEDRGSLPALFLSVLTDTERFAVERRFGLHDGREWNFEEIAEELDLPWPDVRRMVAAALVKPRLPHAHFVYAAGALVVDEFDPADDGGAPLARFRDRVHAAGA